MERPILYKVESGSQMYGTATLESDTDYTSVFLPLCEDLLSLQKCEFINNGTKSSSEDRRNTKEDIDDQQHSLPRYLNLVLHGNPNLVEILFSKKPLVEDSRFTYLKDNYTKLLSMHCYDSFVGFAISQKKKLEYKAKRFLQLRKSLDYLEIQFSPSQLLDTTQKMKVSTATWLNENLSEYKGLKNNVESFHEGLPLSVIYNKIKDEYANYGWRCFSKTFETLGYDVKFASHAIRLLYEGEQILLTGKLEFPISGKAHSDIMDIRNGEVTIDEFYALCTDYEDRCREAKLKSVLNKEPNYKWANNYLVDVLKTAIILKEI